MGPELHAFLLISATTAMSAVFAKPVQPRIAMPVDNLFQRISEVKGTSQVTQYEVSPTADDNAPLSGYIYFATYEKTKCGGNPTTVNGYQLGACLGTNSNEWFIITANGDDNDFDYTVTYYLDDSCATSTTGGFTLLGQIPDCYACVGNSTTYSCDASINDQSYEFGISSKPFKKGKMINTVEFL